VPWRKAFLSLYRSREPSALSLCLKIHLSVTILFPEGRGTNSHVLLDNRASYSSIARHQSGSVSALRTEVGTGDNVRGVATAESCRRSMGLVTLAARWVAIGWVLWGSRAPAMGGRPTARRGRALTRGRMSALVHQGDGRSVKLRPRVA
jgi:hypothetical protein